MDERPSGTVTFLFTDIEGSTILLRALGPRYPDLLLAQRSLIADAAEMHSGAVFGTEGDAVFLVFADATSALRAAAQAQRSLAEATFPDGVAVRVRMGVHTGEASRLGGDYVGLALHETARIAAAGHGGQVLVSQTTASLARGNLADDLGLRDLGDHRLKDLAGPQRLHQLTGPGLLDRFPALRTLEGRPHNLPAQLTSFVGRSQLDDALGMLGRSRLLTLTGPGGTGKTRLALRVAAEALDGHRDGVFFVPLETIRDPGEVPAEILAALSVRTVGGQSPMERLMEHVRDRQLLLVLDNLEQVIEVGPTIARLLRGAPGLRVLATSRIPLRVSGEQELPVPPLELPRAGDPAAAGSEAVRLFVERAIAVQPSFAPDAGALAAVVDIVRRLDGLPLAIELAAARMRTLSPEAIRSRLDHSLGLLTGGARDLPSRQQTLRGAIGWSHDLLDEPERVLFARLGVFEGGIDPELVASVAGDAAELGLEPLDGLDSLADKSLLRAVPVPDGEARFAMLSTIREYAVERLAGSGDEERIRDRHAAAFLALAEDAAGRLTGDGGRAWLDRLEREHENLRAALDRLVAMGDANRSMRLAVDLWRFWQIRGLLPEAGARFDQVLALPGSRDVPTRLLAETLGAAGSVAYWRDDHQGMHRRWAEALVEAERCGDPATIADATFNLGFAPFPDRPVQVSRYAQGLEQFQRALAMYRALDDQGGIARSSWALALGEVYRDEFAAAGPHVAEALALSRAAGDRFYEAWSLWVVAMLDVADGRIEDAERHIREALRAFLGMGDHTGPVLAVFGLALTARRRGDEHRHWLLRGAAEHLRATTGANLVRQSLPALGWDYDERPVSPEDQAAWEAGLLLDEPEAVELALAGG